MSPFPLVSAGDRFLLQAGSAVLEVKQSGEMVIRGTQVKVSATGAVVLEGSSISEN